jgi:predicted nucleic acid-binding protein
VVLGQTDALAEWHQIERAVTSMLSEVECLRTLDRLRLAEQVAEQEIAARREWVIRLLDSVERVAVSRPLLRRAAQPLPVTLGTIDAIHLTTALTWRDHAGEELVMATHDAALARAARAVGLVVLGC